MRRRGQSMVELMIAMPLLVLVLVAMVQLWSITFASENAHIRAREYVLHGDAYLGSRSDGVSGSSVFDGYNYRRADSTRFHFQATAEDQGLPGVSRSPQQIRTHATIASE
jgi:Tfp pilus assembly protein PilV